MVNSEIAEKSVQDIVLNDVETTFGCVLSTIFDLIKVLVICVCFL